MVNIKDWAKNKGIDPNKIKYDKNTKKVMIDGVDYGKGTPTYATKMQAVRPSDTTTYYQKQKVQTGTNYNEAVLDDTFQRDQANRADTANRQAVANYLQMLQKGPGEFQYDQSKDVAYQSAMANAQQNIQTQQRQNLGEMQRRGILNSSITTDRANQIAAEEMRRLQTDIAPQLEQRAYDRYNQNWQNQLSALANMYGITKDESTRLRENVDNARKERIETARYLSNLYGKEVNPTIDPAGMREQVRGMKTWSQMAFDTEQANRKEDKTEAKAIRAQERADQKARDALLDKRWEKEFSRGVLESDRSYALSRSQASSGDSSQTATAEIPKPQRDSVKTVQEMINKGGIGKTVDNDPKTPEQKQQLKRIIDSFNLSANERMQLYRNNGLTEYAAMLSKDPNLKLANSKNVDDKNRLLQIIKAESERLNLSEEDVNRKLIYYGLWDYVYSN